MKRLKRAADDNAVTRAYESVIESTSLDDMIAYANMFRQSWKNGVDTNMVDPNEVHDDLGKWVIDYHATIAQDIISEARKNSITSDMIAALSEDEYNEMFDKVCEYVLGYTQDIANGIEE